MKELAADNRGATAIEYALIATLISLLVVTGATAVGTKLSVFFNSVSFDPK